MLSKNLLANSKSFFLVTPFNPDTLYHFEAIAYVRLDSAIAHYLPGDKLAFKAKLNPFQLTGNPYVFEYGNYLKNKGLKGQFYLKNKEVQRLGSVWCWKKLFYQIGKRAEFKLRQLHVGEAKFGIVTALLLGNKSMLDYNTKANFSSAGAIHVLSVSGLHVGIIYLILMTFIGKIGKGYWGTIKVFSVLFTLWLYAAITGMSPSVFRATLMFSVFVVAKKMHHQYNIYHSLAIAAFIILILNPYAVVHAGFWLSFIAVASIVYFYPQINGLLYFSTPWGKYIWALVSVSLAVQIGTAPLSIYLFGFFPTWFILSNIMVVPVLPFVLIGAIAIVFLPEGSLGVLFLSDSVTALLHYLSDIVAWIGHLPFARFTALQLQFYQILLLYTSLIMFIIWQHLKTGKYLVKTLLFLLIALICLTSVSFNRYQQKVLTVHQFRGRPLISFTTKEECQYWSDNELGKQRKR